MIIRAVKHTYVAEKTLWRKKSSLLVKDSTKELVSRAKALHKDVTLTIVNKLNSLSDSFQLIRIIHDFEFAGIDSILCTDLIDKFCVTYQCSRYKSHIHCLGSGLDSMLVHCPCGNHLFADTFFFQFRKNI